MSKHVILAEVSAPPSVLLSTHELTICSEKVCDPSGRCVECGNLWSPIRVVRSDARGEGWVVARKLPKKNVSVRDAMKLSVCLYGASCHKGQSCTFAHSQGELEL